MSRGVGLAALAFALLLSSCMVGPNYTKPKVAAAPSYSEPAPQSFQETSGWKTAKPSDALLKGRWWEVFKDPDLTALEEQVGPANQSLQIAVANFRQAQTQIQINRSNLFPTIGVGPGVTGNRLSGNVLSTTHPGSEYGLFTLPGNLSWEADLWGRLRRNVTSARELTQASAGDLANVKLELEAELATDYFETRSLDAQKRLLDDTMVAYTRALELTQNRYNGGVASKVEVEQAATQLQQTQAADIDLAVARAQFEHAIAVLVGRVPENYHLPLEPLTQTPPAIPTGVPSELLERRPDIASAERRLASANEQIGIARAAYYPTLTISATGGFQGGSIVNWFTWPSRFWAAGPQLSETVYDAGRRRAVLEGTEAVYDANLANYRQTTLTAFQEVEDSLSSLRILEQESGKQHEATLSAESSLQLSLNRYKGGLVTYLEVITAQTIALANERTDVDLMRRRIDASVELIRALGGGWDTSQLPKV
ncbi:MAG TPA: efflux transporter outer membrane subunit [Bryobacteraceae bacterium]|nr:efflux transporter outer membrane subunit [Bryobacteraceae bacterium]